MGGGDKESFTSLTGGLALKSSTNCLITRKVKKRRTEGKKDKEKNCQSIQFNSINNNCTTIQLHPKQQRIMNLNTNTVKLNSNKNSANGYLMKYTINTHKIQYKYSVICALK